MRNLRIEGLYCCHVVVSDEYHSNDRNSENKDVQSHCEQLIRQCHFCASVAYEQQVLKLLGILLHKEVYAQHEDIETQGAYDKTNDHHQHDDESEEVCCLLSIQAVTLHLKTILFEVRCYPLVSRIVHLHEQASRAIFLFWCKLSVAPVDEGLWHKDGIQGRRECHHLDYEGLLLPIAMSIDLHNDRTHEALGIHRTVRDA